MRLKIDIKFRAFGITFGNWSDIITPPFVIPPFTSGKVIYNNHGVTLSLIS